MIFLKKMPTIHIHPILIIFLIIGFLTGTFMEIAIMLGIVLFHELGHYMMAVSFGWRIKNITLWVFGGVMDTDEHGNRPLYEEALVSIAGPLQHVLIFLFLTIVAPFDVVPQSITELIIYYNSAILLFNLLPVWPLDGGKLLFTLLSAVTPYKKAHTAMILISIMVSICILFVFLFIMSFTLSSIFIFLFILLENRTEWKQRYYVFLRFLSTRFYGKNYATKINPIEVMHNASLFEVFSLFIRERKHVIYITYPGNKRASIHEIDCLRSYFQKKHYNITIGEIKRIS